MGQPENMPSMVIVHHSSRAVRAPQFGPIDEFHKGREFKQSSLGYFVGYHYFIEKDGTVVQARREEEMGQHAVAQNRTSIGVCLAGNFDEELPTRKQIKVLGKLLCEVAQRHRLTEKDIVPHRSCKDTHCYGMRLPDDWAGKVYRAAKG